MIIETYHETQSKISADDLLSGLVAHGMFNEKLPPIFCGVEFLDYCQSIQHTFKEMPSQYVEYENTRNINVPRVLAIPNPFSYYLQCKNIKDNWPKILEHFKKNTCNHEYKVSRIHIRNIGDEREKIFDMYADGVDEEIVASNYIFCMSYKNYKSDGSPESKLAIKSRYLVRADISNCFPSIYTHAIPWAIVGKKIAKNNQNNKEWFNALDLSTRNLKEAETHGVLIGPHSSNIISEIILTTIDKALYDKGYRYLRYIDDYECYLEGYEEAERFLVDLSAALKVYGLALNHRKTEIIKMPITSSTHWVRALNNTKFLDKEEINFKDLQGFLDTALELMSKHNENSAILNYAIKAISKKNLTENAKDYLIDVIHHLVLLYPYLVTILHDVVFKNISLSSERIAKIANDLFDLGITRGNFEVMSYALFFALQYDFNLEVGSVFEKVKEKDDAVLLLIAYLHDKKFINHSAVTNKYKKLAESKLNELNRYWIFVYEVLSSNNFKDDWKALKKKNISFVKQKYRW